MVTLGDVISIHGPALILAVVVLCGHALHPLKKLHPILFHRLLRRRRRDLAVLMDVAGIGAFLRRAAAVRGPVGQSFYMPWRRGCPVPAPMAAGRALPGPGCFRLALDGVLDGEGLSLLPSGSLRDAHRPVVGRRRPSPSRLLLSARLIPPALFVGCWPFWLNCLVSIS